jgi:ATP-dependent Clp protease ATP-binding subunit ClpB
MAANGFHPTYGARPLRREIEHRIENPLSMRMVNGEFKAGDRVRAELEGQEIVLRKGEEKVPAAAGAAAGGGAER